VIRTTSPAVTEGDGVTVKLAVAAAVGIETVADANGVVLL